MSGPTPPALTRKIVIWVLLVLLLVGAAGLRLSIGSYGFGLPSDSATASSILQTRSTRLTIAGIVGVALAVSGVSLQTLLRNPLAEPFILGLSSGAAVGVMLQKLILRAVADESGSVGFTSRFGATHLGALAGAVMGVAVVYMLSRRRGQIDPLGLLLTGVIVSTINGALIMLINYMTGPAGLVSDIAFWMMGYLSEYVSATAITIAAAVTAVGLGVLLTQARAMDVASFDPAEALSMGVNLRALRLVLFLVASALAAAAVALAGPIAFVGLVCPHIARLLLGPRHLPLLLGSALLGAVLLIAADTTSAAIDLTFEIGLLPIGIFTAVVGGPAFLWMLRPQLGRGLE